MTPFMGITPGEPDARVQERMNAVLRHARQTFRQVPTDALPEGELAELGMLEEDTLSGAPPWTVDVVQPRRLWSPASWFATLAVAGAVPLVIVYWMLH